MKPQADFVRLIYNSADYKDGRLVSSTIKVGVSSGTKCVRLKNPVGTFTQVRGNLERSFEGKSPEPEFYETRHLTPSAETNSVTPISLLSTWNSTYTSV